MPLRPKTTLQPDEDDHGQLILAQYRLSRLADQTDNLTHSFIRLANLPTYPLDRLSRYEATLWRQVCQILFTLQCLDRRKPWEMMKPRARRCGPSSNLVAAAEPMTMIRVATTRPDDRPYGIVRLTDLAVSQPRCYLNKFNWIAQ